MTHIVTLLSNPRDPSLDPAAAEALRNAWGGGAIDWLAPDEACEFPVPDAPENAALVRIDMAALWIDMVIQPAEGRRKRMLLADMDSTMIEQECIDELADEAGVGPYVKDITARAMNGELDFEGALTERVALLRGLETGVIDRVLAQRISYMPGGRTLIATMKANGGHAALVSGGFTAFTASVAAGLGFDEHRANTLLIEDGKLSGEVAHPILGRDAKVQALEEISARLGLTAADVIAVGDGANDLGMLARAGTGVALHAKPSVQKQARHCINHGDLTALLYIQGYAKSAFATG
ncbi:phosphoserine phosphatase SerB [Roseivivax sp. CAU 1753]